MPKSSWSWKGYISFGLVNIPVLLFSAENTSTKIAFRQIDKKTGAKIRYKRIDSDTGKEVVWENIGKGYEYDKDKIIPVEEGELQKVAGENARNIAIESFVDKNSIALNEIERTYYLVSTRQKRHKRIRHS